MRHSIVAFLLIGVILVACHAEFGRKIAVDVSITEDSPVVSRSSVNTSFPDEIALSRPLIHHQASEDSSHRSQVPKEGTSASIEGHGSTHSYVAQVSHLSCFWN